MELRRCNTLHFILAIRDGLVIKTPNVDPRGRPGLVFKKLEDIYEATGVKNLGTPSTIKMLDRDDILAFDCDRVKTESPRFPLVERKTKERDSETSESTCNGGDDIIDCDSDDLSFGTMTLKQLKERCRTKKRKVSESVCSTPMQDCTNLKKEEDEFDLMEPLSSWKSKLSKNPKSKKKRMERSVSASPTVPLSVKSEQILDAEDSLQSTCKFYEPITVKVEVPGPEYTECQNMGYVSDDSSICNEQVGIFGVETVDILETVNCELEDSEPISFSEQCKSCVLNEVSYDHLEHVDPTSLLPPIGGATMELDNQEKTGQPSLVLPVSELKEEHIKSPPSNQNTLETVSPPKDQNSDMCNSSQSCSYLQEISGQVNNHSGVQVSDMAVDNGHHCIELCYEGDLCMFEDAVKEDFPPNLENSPLSIPVSHSSTSSNSYPCWSPDNALVSLEDDPPTTQEKQPFISTIADAELDCLNPDNHLVLVEDDSLKDEWKQPPVSVIANIERNFSSVSHPCDGANELSKSEINSNHCVELWHPPERLPSTRKAISPTSQEKLCLAMNSVELYDDIHHYKCKGKLFFGNQNENKALPVIPEGPAQVIHTKITISPKEILKKPKNDKKGSPPIGCFEGPRLSRSLPRLSTGCNSVRGCSESAIAFSQRQMHDIEALAMKLMTELKSMKDIVEEKLFYEAYRNTSLKNDADEVKMAIKNATKVEETSRRWLSMMSRDCSRFCKIMRLTENGAAASENAIHRERKKISFADEAGGMLCHVKFFEDDTSSPESKIDKQELQAK